MALTRGPHWSAGGGRGVVVRVVLGYEDVGPRGEERGRRPARLCGLRKKKKTGRGKGAGWAEKGDWGLGRGFRVFLNLFQNF
jgi:hypothetical protein